MECAHTNEIKECPVHGADACPETVEEKAEVRVPARTGNIRLMKSILELEVKDVQYMAIRMVKSVLPTS